MASPASCSLKERAWSRMRSRSSADSASTVLDTVLIWLNTPEASSRSKINVQVIRPKPIRMMKMVMSRSAQRGSRLRRRLGFG